jgi:hypothetical protein
MLKKQRIRQRQQRDKHQKPPPRPTAPIRPLTTLHRWVLKPRIRAYPPAV